MKQRLLNFLIALDQLAYVLLPGGAIVQARGTAAVGQRVFVRAGAIEGPAPDLTYASAEI